MHLIIILVILAIDRFTQFLDVVQNYNWFSTYIAKVQQYVGSTFLWKDGLPLVCWLAPIAIVVGIVQLILMWVFWGVLGYVFNFLILIYCLGPANIKGILAEYFDTKEAGDGIKAAKAAGIIKSARGKSAEKIPQTVCEYILELSNRNIFAVIFWFLLLGAFGAVIYKFSALLVAESDGDEAGLVTPFKDKANFWLNLLDWIPVRITAILYALAGSFAGCFHHWWSQLLSHPSKNQDLLKSCGMAALHIRDNKLPEGIEQEAIDLVDRSLIVALVIIAIMTIVAWLS